MLHTPTFQVVAVCDPNEQSKDYNEYGSNEACPDSPQSSGPRLRKLGRSDLAPPGMAYLIPQLPDTSLGMGSCQQSREAGRGSVLQLAQTLLQGLHRVSRFP